MTPRVPSDNDDLFYAIPEMFRICKEVLRITQISSAFSQVIALERLVPEIREVVKKVEETSK